MTEDHSIDDADEYHEGDRQQGGEHDVDPPVRGGPGPETSEWEQPTAGSSGDADESGEPPTGSTPPTTAADPDPPTTEGGDGARLSSVRRYVYWATLVGLVGLAALSFLLLYSDLRTVIGVFIADEYVLVIQTAFHLVLLLLAAIGVSLIVRQLEGTTSE